MPDITLNPSALITNGAIVNATNPLPVSVTGSAWASTTWGSIGSASTAGAGASRYVSNVGGGTVWTSNGTRWKALNGMVNLSTLDTPSASIPNSETIVFQYQLPAAFWQVTDRMRLCASVAKSGTTDTAGLTIRIGTAGTTSDTAIFNNTAVLAAGTRQIDMMMDFRLEAATSVQMMTNTTGYGAATSNAFASPVTITDVSNSLWVNVSIKSSSTNDTIILKDGQLFYLSSGS